MESVRNSKLVEKSYWALEIQKLVEKFSGKIKLVSKFTTGGQEEYLILMVAGIAYEYRVSEDELDKALNAITPFIIQGVIQHAEEADE